MKKTFIIPMAFIAASSVSMGTGLIANKVMTTNDTHTESMMTPSTKTSTPTSATMVVSEITSASFVITTSWIDDATASAAPVTHIKYTITGTSGAPTSIVEEISGTGTDVYLVTGLTAGTTYTINAVLYVDDGTTPVTAGNPLEQTGTTTVVDAITGAKINITDVQTTSIKVETTWGDGEVDKGKYIKYVATPEEGDAIEVDSRLISGTESDIHTFTVVADTTYTITATLRDTLCVDLATGQPESITRSTKAAADTMDVVASIRTADTMTIENSWIDGIEQPTSSSYTITEVIAETANTKTLHTETIVGTPADGKDTVTFIDLIADTDYKITGTLTFTTSTNDFDSEELEVSMTTAATEMVIKTTNVIDEEITITNSWTDKTEAPTGSSYTITEVVAVVADAEIVPHTETIVGTPAGGTDTVTFTGLTAETNYEIVGELTFDTVFHNFTTAAKTKVTTEASKLSGGTIAGIVIGSLAGVALLGAGGYWAHTNKFTS